MKKGCPKATPLQPLINQPLKQNQDETVTHEGRVRPKPELWGSLGWTNADESAGHPSEDLAVDRIIAWSTLLPTAKAD